MSSPLDFLISMTLVFLAFSVLVSSFIESWSAIRAKRGRFMWQGIGRMIGDTKEGRQLCEQLRGHSAIAALSRDNQPTSQASYIPSAVFAAALVDVLLARGSFARLEKFGLGEAIAQLSDTLALKKILLMIWRREQGRPERVEAALAVYFDQCMDRVSGWYKRDAQLYSVGVGLVLAAALNVDAVHIAGALWQDRDLARVVADRGPQAARDYAANPANAGAQDKARLLPAEVPVGWPARWARELPTPPKEGQFAAHVLGALLGYVLMALSCLIGAPIWYQLLTSLLPLRATGPAPQRSAAVNDLQSPAAPAATGSAALSAYQAASTPPQMNRLELALEQGNEVKALQALLQAPITGKFDAETRLAIQAAQAERGFAPTGELTEYLLKELRQAEKSFR